MEFLLFAVISDHLLFSRAPVIRRVLHKYRWVRGVEQNEGLKEEMGQHECA